MADVIGNSTEELDDEFFKAYSKKIKDENASHSSNGGSSQSKEYEEVGYAGCDTGIYKIVRLLGAPIGAESQGYKRKPTDPKEVIMCEVKDDKGKRFTIKLPLRAERASDNHILIRMYDKVAEKAYINGTSVFVNKDKHPEAFELITKGGFKREDGNSYTYASGLKGDRLSIYNVIDRTDDWCKNNKHSKILCRSLNVDDQGRTWAKPGIKSFGSVNKIAELLGKYGSFMKYDVALERTGQKENPWNIKNASRLKEAGMLEDLANMDGTEVDADKIVIGPLTPEEKQYELYDLDKFYGPTSYTKIYNRIPSFFKIVDAAFGTHFEDEIKQLSEKEKAEWEANKETQQAQAENAEIQKNLSLSESEVNEATADTGLSDDDVFGVKPQPQQPAQLQNIELLKGYASLPEEIKARIKKIDVADGKAKITWDREDDLLECDDCGSLSPENSPVCPVCGAKF